MKSLAELRAGVELGFHVCATSPNDRYVGTKLYIFREENGLFMFVAVKGNKCRILDEQETLDGLMSFWDTHSYGWALEKVPDAAMDYYRGDVRLWREHEKHLGPRYHPEEDGPNVP